MPLKALIVLNVQNDYCDGKPMGIADALSIIPIINKIRNTFDMIVFIKDLHPKDHISFRGYGGNLPPHCIIGTDGAELNDGLEIKESDYVIHKGTLTLYDSSSAFYNAKPIGKKTNLQSLLDDNKIEDVYVCGFLIETDILSTVIDCTKLRYRTLFIENASRGVDNQQIEEAKKFMTELGVSTVSSQNIEVYKESS